MALLGNILWFVIIGWMDCLFFGLLGILFSITIIGIPIGKALFQYAKLAAFPFGKVIIKETELKGKENISVIRRVGGTIANIIWLPFGVIMLLGNIGIMIVCCITIIGIPIAVALAKSCVFLLWPVGAKVVTKEQAEAIRMEHAMARAIESTGMAGNMAAVNQVMTNAAIPQGADTAQPNQFLENLQENGGKALESLQENGGKALESLQENGGKALEAFREAGGKTLESLKENGGKAVSAIAATGGAGLGSLKEKQREISEQMLAKAGGATLDGLLEQLEAKLYQNRVMAWIMPFLEYITLAVGIIFIVIGLIVGRSVLTGLMMAAPFMLIAALFGMVKRSHIFVLIVLGVQLAANLITGIIMWSTVHSIAASPWMNVSGAAYASGANIIFKMICYIGVIAWYVFTFLIDMKNVDMKNAGAGARTDTHTAILPKRTGTTAAGAKQSFCAQCGTAYTGQMKFCAKCGASLES